jgi:hypothetical protein
MLDVVNLNKDEGFEVSTGSPDPVCLLVSPDPLTNFIGLTNLVTS